jgi:hypothetical protein
MENQSKPGKVSTQKILSAGKQVHHPPFYLAVISGLFVAFVSISCAIGVLDENDPLFNAPSSVEQFSPTPGWLSQRIVLHRGI